MTSSRVEGRATIAPPITGVTTRTAAPRVDAAAPVAQKPVRVASAGEGGPGTPKPGEGGREAFLDEIKRSKVFFYNTVVAQAQKIDFGPDRVTFTFLPAHRTLREQLEQNRQWLESLAGTVSGRKMPVVAAQQDAPADAPATPAVGAGAAQAKPLDLRATAMTDAAVQAMLDVFPAEIEDVEEI